jgi:hypothetical protein
VPSDTNPEGMAEKPSKIINICNECIVLHPTQYLYDLGIFAFDLIIKDKSALVKRAHLSSEDDSYDSDSDQAAKREKLLNPNSFKNRQPTQVKATYPLHRPTFVQTPGE